jgi:hypothetical protein
MIVKKGTENDERIRQEKNRTGHSFDLSRQNHSA